ncbi:MAG: DUF3187 family protein [Thermodesulfobacteriota bacterium]
MPLASSKVFFLLSLGLFLFILQPLPASAGQAGGKPDPVGEEVSFCAGNVGFGPLNLSSQSPFQSLRLALVPRTPDTLSKGEWEIRFTETFANIWSFEPNRYTLDYESADSNLAVAYGVGTNIMLELAIDDRRVFGGILDNFISGFHQLFGISQNDRDLFPNGRTIIDIRDKNGAPLVEWRGGHAAYSQGVAFTVQNNVSCGGNGNPAFSWAVTLRYTDWDAIPIKYDFPLDIGLSLAMAKRFGPIYAYLAPGVVYYGADSVGAVELRRLQMSALLGLEWRATEKFSVIAQYLLLEGACKDLEPFSEPSHEVTLGIKTLIGKKTLVEAGLLENLIVYGNSPDFGIHLGVSHRF